jgi:hypothetical protein
MVVIEGIEGLDITVLVDGETAEEYLPPSHSKDIPPPASDFHIPKDRYPGKRRVTQHNTRRNELHGRC